MGFGYYIVKGNHCQVDKLEILDQAVGSVGFFES